MKTKWAMILCVLFIVLIGCSDIDNKEDTNDARDFLVDTAIEFVNDETVQSERIRITEISPKTYMWNGLTYQIYSDGTLYVTGTVDIQYGFEDAPWVYKGDVITKAVFAFDGAKTIDHLCCNLYNLKEVDLSKLDTSVVTDFSYIFDGCTQLESADLSCLNTSSAKDFNGMFRYCEALTDVKLDGIGTDGVVTFNYMFEGCKSLQAIDLSTLENNNASVDGMFVSCDSLEAVYTGSKWNPKFNSDMYSIE